jgi:hypothetical protein
MERVIAGAANLKLAVALDLNLDNEEAWDLYEGMGFTQSAARETGEAERALVRTPGFARLVRPARP